MKKNLLSLFLVASLVSPGYAQRGQNAGLVSLDFHDVDIQDVAKSIAEITGKNFILDDRVRGKVTVISPQPVTVDEAYQVFRSALEVKNLCAVDVGKVTKIVPLRECKGNPIATEGTEGRARGDEIITKIISLQYLSAEEIKKPLNPLVSKTGTINVGPNNTLMLTDNAANIERIQNIIARLDKPSSKSTVEFIPIKYGDANDIAQKLTNIFEKGKASAGFRRRTDDVEGEASVSKIIPDTRTNSLLVMATREGLGRILDLLGELDQPPSSFAKNAGRIHVRPIQHANAEELAKVLSSLLSGTSAAPGGKKKSTKEENAAKRGFTNAAPLPWEEGGAANPEGSLGSNSSENSPGSPSVAVGGGEMFQDEVRIVADPSTNSLIITATPTDFLALDSVITELDVTRPQVFVEALIMEVDMDKAAEVGVTGHGGGAVGTFNLFGSSSPGKGLSSAVVAASPAEMAKAAAPGGGLILGGFSQQMFKIGGITIPINGALFHALQTNNVINVLSAPNILTTDNKKAEISVGSKVPIPSSQYTATGGGVPVTQYSREDVALSLSVTPHINEGDEVTLEIEQKIQEIDTANTKLKDGVVTTNERSAKTTVVAQNAQTIVIGGLIKEKDEKGHGKVPVLGDIPIIKYLFRDTKVSKTKMNLVLFLTPHVIHSPDDLTRVSVKKNNERQKFNKSNGIAESQGIYDYELDKGLNMAPPPRADRRKETKPHFDYDHPSDTDESATPPSDDDVATARRRSSGGKARLTSADADQDLALPRRKGKKGPAASPFSDVRPPSSTN